jgi:site-specific recombinase XerD
MANRAPHLVSPANEMQTVRAGGKPNAKLRTREYLTEPEVGRLIKAASSNRHGHRNATLLLVIFQHGLRASEALRCAGPMSISSEVPCMCIESKMAIRACIRCPGASYAHCGD